MGIIFLKLLSKDFSRTGNEIDFDFVANFDMLVDEEGVEGRDLEHDASIYFFLLH